MQNLQDIWIRIQETKKEQKSITASYKDALDSSHEYRDIQDKLKTLGARKKQIETEVKNELGQQYEKLQSLKTELQLDKELLTDVALSSYLKGDTVKIVDPENNEYEPVFSVRFQKANTVNSRTA